MTRAMAAPTTVRQIWRDERPVAPDIASATGESLRFDAQDDGREHDDRDSTYDGTDEGADENLSAAENQGSQGQARNGDARDEDEHEGIDEPGQAHVGIDRQQRRDQRARGASESGAKSEGHGAHPDAVDAEAAREILVHDHRAGVQAEAGEIEQRRQQKAEDDSDRYQNEPPRRVAGT